MHLQGHKDTIESWRLCPVHMRPELLYLISWDYTQINLKCMHAWLGQRNGVYRYFLLLMKRSCACMWAHGCIPEVCIHTYIHTYIHIIHIIHTYIHTYNIILYIRIACACMCYIQCRLRTFTYYISNIYNLTKYTYNS